MATGTEEGINLSSVELWKKLASEVRGGGYTLPGKQLASINGALPPCGVGRGRLAFFLSINE